MIYNIIIGPIETLVDWVFHFIINKIPQVGVIGAVIGVSLTINYLALPLYNIADSLQEKERKIQKELSHWVSHIKKTFKGDERFMMLQAYYRENHYHPLYSLRSSLSILIEIPFFIAAYHYLSHCEALKNVSFWIFKDLGAPDGLLSFHAFGHLVPIHVLPILMTLINFVSGAVYTKDAVFKEKIQQYAIASIFLVLLYKSPSGLVIYWILNNIFSLLKNVVNTTKNPAKIAHISLCVIFTLASLFYLFSNGKIWRKLLFIFFVALVFALPLITQKLKVLHKNNPILSKISPEKKSFSIFLFSALVTTMLVGYILPYHIFLNDNRFFIFNPKQYIFTTLPLAIGFFIFWPICIYKMFGNAVKISLTFLAFVCGICVFVNIFAFHTDFSLLTMSFDFTKGSTKLNFASIFIPLAVFLLSLTVLLVCLAFKKQLFLSTILFLCLVAGISISIKYTISSRQIDYKSSEKETYAYLNSLSPESSLEIRRRSHKQIKNFITSQTLPPMLRESFFFQCSEKSNIQNGGHF